VTDSISDDSKLKRRKIEIDTDVLTDLIEKVAVLTDRIESVPHDLHDEHHRFVEAYIETRRQREVFWRDVREKLITKGIFGTIGLVFWVSLALIAFWFNNHKV